MGKKGEEEMSSSPHGITNYLSRITKKATTNKETKLVLIGPII